MNKPTQRLITLVAVSSLLLASVSPALAYSVSTAAITFPIAASGISPVAIRSANEVLFSSLNGSIENIHSDKTLDGTRLIAKVILRNKSNKIVRIPAAYEARLVMDNGLEYTLSADAGNNSIIQPLNEVKLSFMAKVETEQTFVPVRLEWVKMNLDVYPKVETVKLALHAPVINWENDSSEIVDISAIYSWGEKFTIPSLQSSLTYTPVSLKQEKAVADDKSIKNVTFVTFLVENSGGKQETIPDLSLNAKTVTGVVYSSRAESESIRMESFEKKYITYSFAAGDQSKLVSLTILIPETFMLAAAAGPPASISYSIGRLKIDIPENILAAPIQAKEYVWDTPMLFNTTHSGFPSNVQVSIVGESLLANDEVGFKTMLVQLKLNNKGEQTLELPDLPLELISPDGNHYTGIRESTSIQQLIPNTSYVIPYTFLLPGSESGQQLTLQALDTKSYAPFKSVLAAYKLTLPIDPTNDLNFMVYPYKLAISSKGEMQTIGNTDPLTGNASIGLSWKTDINLIRAQNILISSTSSSKLQFEVLDGNNRLLGTTIIGFSGAQKLINGEQEISFNNVDLNSSTKLFPLTIRIYETYDTPLGMVKRYLGQFIQS